MTRPGPLSTLLIGCALIFAIDWPWGDFQNHPHWNNIGRVPFLSGPVKPFDVAQNILLGVPLGIGAAQTFSRPTLAAASIALPVSLLGEATQIYSHSRFPSATDVTCNVLGAVLASIARRRRGET
jgi:glycopeptide antibiotics resistance protein